VPRALARPGEDAPALQLGHGDGQRVTAEIAPSVLACRAAALRSLCESEIVSDVRRARFARLVSRALDDLPAEFRERMRNVEVVVHDAPDEEQLREHGGELLGLYEGVPLTDRRDEPWLPDRISIYRQPIERISSSPRVQARIVRDTVVHEIAHHFGITDERLHELGLGDSDS
jgi:predicted Zn-dependent protease with MMP-like domain